MPHDELMLFALEGSTAFGQRVGSHLGLPLSAHEDRSFEDGERKARPLSSVRGRDVYVIHSLHGDAGQSPNDKLCRLLFFIGALRDAAARRVTAVVPYLCYARKDRQTKPRDPVITRYVAALFEAVGTDVVVTLDVHNLAAFQNAFRCRTEQLEANGLFLKFLAPLLRDGEAVVVAPDAGGIKRAEQFRLGLAALLPTVPGAAFMAKTRSEGVVRGELLAGELKGRHAVIIDDLISTGTTVLRAAKACRDAGALSVTAAASHGLFAGDPQALLDDPALDRIVVTDSIAPRAAAPHTVPGKLNVIGCADLFAAAIAHMHGGPGLSAGTAG